MPIFLYALVGNILSSYFSGKCENRNTILQGRAVYCFNNEFYCASIQPIRRASLPNIPIKIAFVLLGGIGSSFIALGLLPVMSIYSLYHRREAFRACKSRTPAPWRDDGQCPRHIPPQYYRGQSFKGSSRKHWGAPFTDKGFFLLSRHREIKNASLFHRKPEGFLMTPIIIITNMSALIILSMVKEV